MAHWMDDLRRQQSELGVALATSLLTELMHHVPNQLSSLDGMFQWSALVPRDAQPDSDVLRTLLEQEVHDDVLEAMHGYTDWAAARIVRSGDFDKQPLLIPDANELQRIATTYGVTTILLNRVVSLLRGEQRIPLLGTIVDGRFIVPDREALLRWRELYNWS